MYSLINGDSLKLMRELPNKCIDLIVTDPPYDISATNGGGSVNNVKKLNESLQDLTKANLTNGYNFEAFNNEFIRLMKVPNIYIWCNKIQLPKYFNFYVNKHKCKFDILCWHKTNALPTYSNKYLSDTEYCLYFRGSGKCYPNSYEDAKTYYIAPINHADKKEWGHPTIKPLDFTQKCIRNSSKEGDVILDPFVGSGTTIIAAEIEHRKSIGIEINKEYYNIAKQRIELE